MKTPLRLRSWRLAPALGLLALAALAPAQAGSHTGPDNPEQIARIERERPTVELAYKLQQEAWNALRDHRYADAERLATRSIGLFEGTTAANSSFQDHVILAEAYLAQRRYDLALAETLTWKNSAQGGRYDADEALALLGLGRTDEARRLLVKIVGAPETRDAYSAYDLGLPVDDDPSDDALLASAYVVRAGTVLPESPEAYDDLKVAERYAPRNPILVTGLAFYLSRAKRYEEARAYYVRAASINEPQVRSLGRRGIADMDRAIAARDKAKADGVKVP